MSQNIEKRKDAFAELLDIMQTLREKCPWDHKQTMESLRNLTVEEVYELGDAVLRNDLSEVKKELGDLLMHIVFYALLGEEKGAFDIEDVLQGISEKLRYRHPHVYGEVQVENEQDVLQNWEQLKLKEKDRHQRVLEGVPVTMPALVKAYRVQDKVRGVGFDWRQKEDVWEKVREELCELEEEVKRADQERMEEEFGDFLFATVNAARLYRINPEDALEKANRKFIRRFSRMEELARDAGKSMPELTFEEMDDLWNTVKEEEKRND